MKQAIDLAKKIYKEPSKNWLSELELLNLHTIFRPVYSNNFKFELPNQIVSFIIMAYDNDGPWIDPRKDRAINKKEIWNGIGGEETSPTFKQILEYDNDDIQQVILKYLLSQTDARWQEIISLLDYSSKMILFANSQTNDRFKIGSTFNEETKVLEDDFKFLDQAEIAKTNAEKGKLLLQAIDARKKAEELLKTLENDFQKVDHATQGDFGFQFSDVRKFDVTSWEMRLRKRKSIG